ncbi:hypothetical protein Pyn_21185 [Prunus yedoensis var. nudiflora]|uniref:Uncharacterized protein n=1 Tax=Prunus yedoensis var. nudiflora TaxID=2094558 RepID=A0A314XJ83_PRUYE|nr:hypothetical protein Pyn_21185 [Prunus yedoensis var. nudiflora]
MHRRPSEKDNPDILGHQPSSDSHTQVHGLISFIKAGVGRVQMYHNKVIAAILREQGMYLETSIYRPVIPVLMLFLIMSLNMMYVRTSGSSFGLF